MKKQLLLTLVLSLMVILAKSQCTPDIPPDGTHSHLYPDTTVNLPHASVGAAYGGDMQFYIGTDTVTGGYNVHIVNFIIDSVIGLPPGFSYATNPSSGTFPGGTTDCAHFYGPAPTTGMVGTYPFTIYGKFNTIVNGIIPYVLQETVTGYKIVIDNLPFITANGSTNFCQGSNITLTASVGSSYLWNTGATSQSITVSASGNYSVRVGSLHSDTTKVTVYPLPTVNAGSNVSIPSGTSTTLSGSASGGSLPYAYAWTPSASLVNANIQNPTTVNLSTTTIFTLTVTDFHGCNGTNMVTVTAVPNSTISGAIVSEQNAAVRTVTLNVIGGGGQTMTTATNGLYSFTIPSGQNDTIRPAKNNDVSVTNGITTLDILLIQRHILNTTLLATPYKIIAADVNLSGTVTTLDILLIRQLILGTRTSFPNGVLWNFVPSDYVFANPANPFPFNNYKYYSSVTTQTNKNFIGMKLGDVNNSWNNTIAKTDYVGSVNIDIPSGNVFPNEQIKLPITARQFKSMSGYQFTINWNPSVLSFTSVKNAATDAEFGLLKQQDGELSVLWTAENATSLDLADETPLFYLTFKAVGNTGDISPVSITSSFTPIEAVNNNLDLVELKSNAGTVSIGQLTIDNGQLSIYPNPFNANTTVRFALPEKKEVMIKVFNILGVEVAAYKGVYSSGEHEMPIGTKELFVPGTYYLQFKAGDFSKVIKMMRY